MLTKSQIMHKVSFYHNPAFLETVKCKFTGDWQITIRKHKTVKQKKFTSLQSTVISLGQTEVAFCCTYTLGNGLNKSLYL